MSLKPSLNEVNSLTVCECLTVCEHFTVCERFTVCECCTVGLNLRRFRSSVSHCALCRIRSRRRRGEGTACLCVDIQLHLSHDDSNRQQRKQNDREESVWQIVVCVFGLTQAALSCIALTHFHSLCAVYCSVCLLPPPEATVSTLSFGQCVVQCPIAAISEFKKFSF